MDQDMQSRDTPESNKQIKNKEIDRDNDNERKWFKVTIQYDIRSYLIIIIITNVNIIYKNN